MLSAKITDTLARAFNSSESLLGVRKERLLPTKPSFLTVAWGQDPGSRYSGGVGRGGGDRKSVV